MAWETRTRGGRYYTHSFRSGGKVCRMYLGTGPVAELAGNMVEERRLQREAERQALKAEEARWSELEGALKALDAECSRLVKEALVMKGYHQHKRQWRKRRGQN